MVSGKPFAIAGFVFFVIPWFLCGAADCLVAMGGDPNPSGPVQLRPDTPSF